MSETTFWQNQWQRSTIRRFGLWLLSWRVLRFVLVGIACFFTIIVLFYVVENWRGKRAWENCKRELEAQGEQLDLAAFVPPPVPPEQNFAMTPFLAPLFDFMPGTQTWRDTGAVSRVQQFASDFPDRALSLANWRLGRKTDWGLCLETFQEHTNTGPRLKKMAPADTTPVDPAKAAAAILAHLKPYESVLAELRTALQRPHARFNLCYETEDYTSVLLPHLAVVRRCGQIAALRALAELTLGQAEDACQDALLGLKLADTVVSEPLLVSQLVRCAIVQVTLQPVWEGLADRRWSDTQLRSLQQRLQQFDFISHGVQAIRGERAGGNSLLNLVRAKPMMLANLGMGENQGSSFDPIIMLLPRGWLYREQVHYNRLYQEFVLPGSNPKIRQVDPALLEQNDARLDRELTRGSALLEHRFFSRMMLPALTRIHQKFAHAQAAVDEAVIACALERHRLAEGRFPEALDALVPHFLERLPRDVIGGAPLKYRRTDNGQFTLYSVGWNRADDGGKPGLTKKQTNVDLTQGDWVWR